MGVLRRQPRMGGAIRAALGVAGHRELIIRSSGRVLYVPLPGSTQLMLLLLLAGISGWVAYTSAIYFRHYKLISGQEAQLAVIDERNEALEHSRRDLAALTERNSELTRELQGLDRDLHDSESKRAEQTKRQMALNRRMMALKAELEKSEVNSREFAGRVATEAERLEQLIKTTGLKLAEFIKQPEGEETGSGGPYFPLTGSAEKASDETGIELVERQMARWEELRELVRSLPLVAPMRHYRLTSTFGGRKDPINGRMARHEGIDLSGPVRSPIYATAAGKIVFSGWKGGLGRAIIIDHGNGIRTRYGHLRKTLVKRGQKVAFGQKIGQLGSSGRSTGPHVHYEILVRGKPVDPEKFLKAGRDAFKG